MHFASGSSGTFGSSGTELIEVLLDYGADLDATNKYRQTPLNGAPTSDTDVKTMLREAAVDPAQAEKARAVKEARAELQARRADSKKGFRVRVLGFRTKDVPLGYS